MEPSLTFKLDFVILIDFSTNTVVESSVTLHIKVTKH